MTTNTFFDIYSSPIVRSFFSSYVDRTCSIDLVETEFDTLVNGISTKYSRNRRQVAYYTKIDSHIVIFTITLDGDNVFVSFDIDYSFARKDLPKSVKFKIIKWLLAVWSIEQHNYSKFICSPCCEGNKESNSWRGTYYSKFGFTWINDKTMVLVK